MPITKTGETLIKEAVTRWKDFIQTMGASDRQRLFDAEIVKPLESYISGINRGTANILKRLGYTRGNIDAFTDEQMLLARNRTREQLVRAQSRNDSIGVSRNLEAQKQQGSISNTGINQTALRYENPRSFQGAETLPGSKMIHIKHMELPGNLQGANEQALFKAMMNRHEAYEASAAEKAFQQYLRNRERGDAKAIRKYRATYPQVSSLSDQQILDSTSVTGRAMIGIKTPAKFKARDGSQVPNHFSMGVLTNERKLLDTFPYKDNAAYQTLRDLRANEYRFMDLAGNYPVRPQVFQERFNTGNYRELSRKLKSKTPIEVNPGEFWTPLY